MQINADEYFRWWKAPRLYESQSKFQVSEFPTKLNGFRENLLAYLSRLQFLPGADTAAVRQGLSQKIHLAILEGVDPSPSNLCAAGLLALKVCLRHLLY